MANRKGITEEYWSSLSEDRRFFWKMLARSFALVIALFVLKTGNRGFDWFVGGFAALLPMLVIESQRSYRKFSSGLRKAIIRTTIFLGSWGTACLGIAYLSQAAFIAIVSTFSHEVLPSVQKHGFGLLTVVMLAAFVAASSVAVIRAIRQLRFEELIFGLPRQKLSELLVQRRFVASNFTLFACFELSVLTAGFVYASLAAGLANALFVLLE